MIKSILFPTDFSPGSEAATPFVADMARLYGARVHLLHVVHDMALTSGWFAEPMDLDEIYKNLSKRAEEELAALAAGPLSAFQTERMVIVGHPADDILTYADAQSIEMIVMGTHGRSGIDRVLFGSTALNVVKHAECPVLTVRIPA